MTQVPAVKQDDQSYIILTGIKNPAKVDTYFASSMVDVAFVVQITSSAIKVVPDEGIDLSKQEDVDWLTEIVQIALSECDEAKVAIEVHVEH